MFIDSSVFLKLLLNEREASEAEEILKNIELNRTIGYITPLVLEEVSFKLLFAEASSRLGTTNVWKIRDALKNNADLRAECIKTFRKFLEYIENISLKGLKVEGIFYDDWLKSVEYVERYGLLPADALHLAVAQRLGINVIATFDDYFKLIGNIKTLP